MALVVIDPGHGKETAGKRSPDALLLEYEFNRDVAKRIVKYLEDHGVKTLLTCLTDSVLNKNNTKDLKARCNLANKANADLFVSIHANAYDPDGNCDWNSANGWEIFTYKNKGEGYELAKEIQSESIPYLGIRNRGIKDGSSYYVIKHTKMPAVLIEHGFYTNKTECALLKSDEFREKCAIADAKGILKHLGIAWKEPIPEGIKEYAIEINGVATVFKAAKINGKIYVPFADIESMSNFTHSIDGDTLKLVSK